MANRPCLRPSRVGVTLIVVPIFLSGCKLSLGAAGNRAWSTPPSNHIGFTTQGMVAFPQEYRYVAGFETATLIQTSPSIHSDQWRAGIVGGYSASPEPTEIFGWELLGRAQAMRGSQGTFNNFGFVFGASVGLPFRTSKRDPWNVDDLVGIQGFFVPSVGVNAVCGGDQSLHPEIAITLSYRFELSHGVLP